MKQHLKILKHLVLISRDVIPVRNASLASAIVFKNTLVSFGVNIKKTHPFQNIYKKNEHAIYLHAEVHAIKNALRVLSLKKLSKSTLYIARSTKLGWGLAKPCSGCLSCIEAFDIPKVVFTTNTLEEFNIL